MTVLLLVDNDIVIKLARMGTYSTGIASVGMSPNQVGSLRVMLRYMGIADEKRRERLTSSKAESERLNRALHSIVEIEMSDAEANTAASIMKVALENDLDLDEGELALITVAITRGGLDVATGDKRALRSLPALECHWQAVAALRRRFICLEQVFKCLCKAHGISYVRTAVTTSPRADDAITYVYSEVSAGESNRFIAALDLMLKEHVEAPAPGWLKSL